MGLLQTHTRVCYGLDIYTPVPRGINIIYTGAKFNSDVSPPGAGVGVGKLALRVTLAGVGSLSLGQPSWVHICSHICCLGRGAGRTEAGMAEARKPRRCLALCTGRAPCPLAVPALGTGSGPDEGLVCVCGGVMEAPK